MKSVKHMDEEKFCSWDDYRAMILIPIFAKGVSKFANYIASPQDQAKAGMAQVFKFICDHNMHCGEPDLVDAAAEIAIEIAELLFEADTVAFAFDDLKKWMIQYCGDKGIETPKKKLYPAPYPKKAQRPRPGSVPKRMVRHR